MELTWRRRAISTLLFRNLQNRLLIENLLAFPTYIDGAVVRKLVFLRRERLVSELVALGNKPLYFTVPFCTETFYKHEYALSEWL